MNKSLYQPLPTPTSIRLLIVHPGEAADKLECDLQVVELENATPYETLSYTWGSPDPTATIQVCGKEATVTPNLAAALHRVRAGPRTSFVEVDSESTPLLKRDWPPKPKSLKENTTESRILWVDALCIDQENLEERSEQVGMMSNIYEHATRVLIWLGEGFPECSLSLSLLAQIRLLFQDEADVEDPFSFLSLRTFYEATSGMIKILGLPEVAHPAWTALHQFYSLPWFSRVWVMQELIVSRAAIVLVSEYAIDWDSIGVAPYWLLRKGFMRALEFGGALNGTNAGALNYYRKARPRTRIRPFLVGFLYQSGHWSASDPRDKVFAVLGLAEETRDLENFPQMVPNYTKSTLDVYMQAAWHLLVHDVSNNNAKINVLSAVQHFPGSSKDEFPSWVPRWDRSRIGVLANTVSSYGWCTSRRTKASIILPEKADNILVGGFCFDRVKVVDDRLHQVYKPSSTNRKSYNSAFKAIWDTNGSQCTSYPSGELREDAFAATLTAGTDTGFPSFQGRLFNHFDFERATYHDSSPSFEVGETATGADFPNLSEELEELHLGRQMLDLEPPSRVPVLNKSQPPHSTRRGPTNRYRSFIEYRCEFGVALRKCNETSRLFFTTEKGYMGLGPPTLQPGDDICVIFGGITPFMLRKQETSTSSSNQKSTYGLVGECYVHGIMGGEAMDEFETGVLKEEIFDIR